MRRLLLIAPHCDGKDVGEARSAHQLVSRLAAQHDVTLLTYGKKTATPARAQLPGVRVVEWPDLPLVHRVERFNAAAKPGYVLFARRARKWIKRALKSGERFDLAHQLSPLALRFPCPAIGLVRPLVVGPLAGSLTTPSAFASEFGSEPWYMKLRGLDALRFRHDPSLRRTYRGADVLIGVAPYVRELIEGAGIPIKRFETMTEVGLESLPPEVQRPTPPKGTLKLLFVGRVVRSKGVRDAVRALAQLADYPGVTLDVVGDGHDRPPCEEEAERLGVAPRVTFHGRVPRERVDAFYRDADAFLFPSFREPSGNAAIEAMSWSLPMIVADRGGPTHAVDDVCAIRVPAESPEQFSADLARATGDLANRPADLAGMGRAARQRASKIALWPGKIERLTALYDELAPAGARTPSDGARSA